MYAFMRLCFLRFSDYANIISLRETFLKYKMRMALCVFQHGTIPKNGYRALSRPTGAFCGVFSADIPFTQGLNQLNQLLFMARETVPLALHQNILPGFFLRDELFAEQLIPFLYKLLFARRRKLDASKHSNY